MSEQYQREWFKRSGGEAIAFIIKQSGSKVVTGFSPVQGGFFWKSENFQSEGYFSEPYEALLDFITWSVINSNTVNEASCK